jgi:hypothetical protein
VGEEAEVSLTPSLLTAALGLWRRIMSVMVSVRPPYPAQRIQSSPPGASLLKYCNHSVPLSPFPPNGQRAGPACWGGIPLLTAQDP